MFAFVLVSVLMAAPALSVTSPAAAAIAPAMARAGSLPESELALAQAQHTLDSPGGPQAALSRVGVSGNWSVLSVPTRSAAPSVFDAADGYVLGIGNVAEGALNATWTLNGTQWVQMPTTRAPSARVGGALAYDPLLHEVLLFGGNRGSTFYNDTWAYHAGSWTELSAGSGPSPRSYAALGYDAYDATMILFGGEYEPCTAGRCPHIAYDDTWSFGPTGWKNVTRNQSVSPSPRFGSLAMNNSSVGPLVLFGGQEFTSSTVHFPPNSSYPNGRTVTYWGEPPLNDTWIFESGRWTHVVLAGSTPPANDQIRLTSGLRTGSLTLLDGYNTSSCPIRTWEWNRSVWNLLNTSSCPWGPERQRGPRNIYFPAVYDPPMGGVVWLGDPLWLLSGQNWSVVQPATHAPSSYAPEMVWDAADHYVLLFEVDWWPCNPGCVFNGPLAQTWTYANGSWTQLTLTVHPPANLGYAITYDSADGYVLLFGGAPYGSANPFYGSGNTTWTFAHGNWTALLNTSTHAPPPRWAPQMAYDARDGYVVLFGGNTGASGYWCGCMSWFNDTWTFKAGLWTQVTPTGSIPPARVSAAMTYDPACGSVVMYGGTKPGGPGGFGPLADTWEFRAGNWTNVTTSGGPGAREAPAIAFDSSAQLLLEFGGSHSQAVWAFRNGTWKVLAGVSSGPADHTGPGFVYDPQVGAVLLLGGGPDWKVQDAWLLRVS